MVIKNPKYVKNREGVKVTIICEINGHIVNVPIIEGNRHYDEIQKLVKEGTLTIKDAD
tara:strand:- start:424 stop:597 length:174 start_codon:yes stop_codon:yes gene_type:complete